MKAEGVETCGDLIDRRAHLYLLNPAHTFEYLMRIGLGLGFADDQGGGEANAKDELVIFNHLDNDLSHVLNVINTPCGYILYSSSFFFHSSETSLQENR